MSDIKENKENRRKELHRLRMKKYRETKRGKANYLQSCRKSSQKYYMKMKETDRFRCKTCERNYSSAQSLRYHMNSKKHQRNLQAKNNV